MPILSTEQIEEIMRWQRERNNESNHMPAEGDIPSNMEIDPEPKVNYQKGEIYDNPTPDNSDDILSQEKIDELISRLTSPEKMEPEFKGIAPVIKDDQNVDENISGSIDLSTKSDSEILNLIGEQEQTLIDLQQQIDETKKERESIDKYCDGYTRNLSPSKMEQLNKEFWELAAIAKEEALAGGFMTEQDLGNIITALNEIPKDSPNLERERQQVFSKKFLEAIGRGYKL